jgi:hypothetical protein
VDVPSQWSRGTTPSGARAAARWAGNRCNE